MMLVTADDSTGATEAGAACADAGWIVDVVPFSGSAAAQSDCNCTVIDLRSRHLAADEARRRIIATSSDAHRIHKIDSTLRGNWAAELAALVEGGRRVVLIPSHPRAGRVCVHGVVYVNGVPVAESDLGNDPRLPVRNSRPRETLPATEVRGPDELVAWLAMSSAGVAIADATTLDEIHELVQIALHPADVVLSGPASVVEAVATLGAPQGLELVLPDPLLPKPVVVVCASLHPVARAQIAAATEAGIEVVTSSEVRGADSEGIAIEVAARAHRLVAASEARSVILVGGDTAEAFIGASVVRVHG
ncbi:MAG TPA: four-carbon acid sugar kinase family protein, partial [Ilumatobacteraceae bacterium]|nr:four-carbon acid sugar kinase family protein [Ilumatobacteraceae bacterium]